MNKARLRNSCTFFAIFISLPVILIVTVTALRHAYSQASGCPTTKTTSWAKGKTVYYNYGNITDPAIKAQIKAAADKWTAANANNGSGVTFALGPPPQGASGFGTISFQTGAVSNGIANTSYTGVSGTTFTGATITFDTSQQNVYDPASQGYDTMFLKQALHELGHTMGLDHPPNPTGNGCDQANGASVMNYTCNTNDQANNQATDVTSCDNQTVNQRPPFQPTPTPTPTPTECSEEQSNNCGMAGMLPGPFPGCACSEFHHNDPILVDVLGDGFSLTSFSNGVSFDIDADGIAEHLAWTSPDADDAFLTLDRNGNGTIDNGFELFGDVTPQPPSNLPHGFIALAEYDKPQCGGNGDGLIKKSDAVFSSLRLWQDTNHNGVSEPAELHSLKQLGLKSIDVDYHRSGRRDQHGNVFRYRAKVKDNRDAQLGRWAWDVFLISEQ